MGRLIDADELLKKKFRAMGSDGFRHGDYIVNAKAVCDAPTVEAVPVVRCKDCKFFQEETLLDDILIGSHCGLVDSANVHGYRNGEPSFDTTLLWRNENDYCSRGEMEDDEKP